MKIYLFHTKEFFVSFVASRKALRSAFSLEDGRWNNILPSFATRSVLIFPFLSVTLCQPLIHPFA
jgi:hypothetical protein